MDGAERVMVSATEGEAVNGVEGGPAFGYDVVEEANAGGIMDVTGEDMAVGVVEGHAKERQNYRTLG